METTNQELEQWRDALEKILEYYVDLPYRYGEVKNHLIVSGDRNHFLLLHEGWEDRRHVHGTVVHAEFRDGKIWIHYDGVEDGITDDLVNAGVPTQNIVLAFQPPHVREHTDYAVA